MYSRLFATTLNQFGNRPMAAFNACGHSGGHPECAVSLAEIVIREVERDSGFKVFQFLAAASIIKTYAD